eukprot:354575-Chlamydomonas_euryale.AAC.15
MHEGPVLGLAGSSLHKTCLSRPPVSAYHACGGRGRPETEDMHARKCPRPPASGMYVHACPRPRAGRDGRDRPRPSASAHILCTDHPDSVSY